MCEEKEKNNFSEVKQDMKELIQLLQNLNLGQQFQNNKTIVESFKDWLFVDQKFIKNQKWYI